MKTIFIGVDNGVSGGVGILTPTESFYYRTPTIKQRSYTKEKKFISRLDVEKFKDLLKAHVQDPRDVLLMFERPMVNPRRFAATMSAVRCAEAALIVVEALGYTYEWIDSRKWQHALLPDGITGSSALKAASLAFGKKTFPQLAEELKKDADPLAIAWYLKKMEHRTL